MLGLFSTHSHVLTLRIARPTPRPPSRRSPGSSSSSFAPLFAQGSTPFLMKLIATINEQLIAKAFSW